MIIEKFINPPLENNNYLIIDDTVESSRKPALLIDCSEFNEKIAETLKKHNAYIERLVLTHGHFDHIIGIPENREFSVYMHKGDVEWVENVNIILPMFNIEPMTPPHIDFLFEEEHCFQFGNIKVQVILTPGHTKGGVCYLIDNYLFSGDTLFHGAVGRTDLQGGDYTELIDSIKMKLFTLPENTIVYPGHGESTTIKIERETNPYCN
jgi:glyoxylase-like metal-dependent hydrolase (beta-lactamase superfamily II)